MRLVDLEDIPEPDGPPVRLYSSNSTFLRFSKQQFFSGLYSRVMLLVRGRTGDFLSKNLFS